MTKPTRSPERAAKIIDRAARMKAFAPSVWDYNPVNRQMKTPGRAPAPFAGIDFLGSEHLVSRGVQDVPLNRMKTHQQTVSVGQVKDKIAQLGAGRQITPGQVLKIGDTYHALDGNHGGTARRALGHSTTQATVFELRSAAPQIGMVPARPVAPAAARVPMKAVGRVGMAVAVAGAAYGLYKATQGGRTAPKAQAPAAPPPAKPQRGAEAGAGRNSYTTRDGRAVQGTKAQIAAWSKRRSATA